MKRTSILIADDDANIRKILNFILKNNGFDVIEAVDGDDAFQKFMENEVDMIISDIMMPGIDGLELCRRIKYHHEEQKKIYFILLSAKGELNDKIIGLELGADEYIPKPFEPLEVLARVKSGERILKLQNKLENDKRFFETLAFIDELTQLYNRRFFKEVLQKEFASAKRYKHPLSIILIDVDRFKSFNDRYGHPTGDVVLKRVASVLKDIVRESDTVSRYGGEEFAILMTNTKKDNSLEMAERIRKEIEVTKIQTDYGELNVTISLGIGVLEDNNNMHIDSAEEVFDQADKALLKAKETGRNRVCY